MYEIQGGIFERKLTISIRVSAGLFNQPTGNVSYKYSTYITPSGWTFIIWAVIYSWMAVALVYGQCRSEILHWRDHAALLSRVFVMYDCTTRLQFEPINFYCQRTCGF